MSPVKASRLDGFPALFYQKYWHIIRPDVTHFCISVLQGAIPIAEINKTHCFDFESWKSKEYAAIQTNQSLQCVVQNYCEGCGK